MSLVIAEPDMGRVQNFGAMGLAACWPTKTMTTRSEGALFPSGIGNESKSIIVQLCF
jgi:hypothetical protein